MRLRFSKENSVKKAIFLAVPAIKKFDCVQINSYLEFLDACCKKIANQKYQKWSFLEENQNVFRIFISQLISKISTDPRPMRNTLNLFTTREKLSKFDSPYPWTNLGFESHIIHCESPNLPSTETFRNFRSTYRASESKLVFSVEVEIFPS